MKNSRHSRARQIQSAIGDVLREHWNPLNLSRDPDWPRDEYDRYIGPVYHVLSTSRSEEDVIDCLLQIEATSFGFSPRREALRGVANRLLAIDIAI